ncbi:MAG: hypothetical protein AB1486_21600 [Planctomycetota bacterium]
MRLLPLEILPHKSYALSAFELVLETFFAAGVGLRPAVQRLVGERPHFSTLHGWLGAVGQYALGRTTPAGALPLSAVLEETRRHAGYDVQAVFDQPVAIDPARYRSESRHDELAGAARFLQTARSLYPAGTSLVSWGIACCRWLGVAPWRWFSRLPDTRIQHRTATCAVVGSAQRAQGAEPCEIRTRSPPGDTK